LTERFDRFLFVDWSASSSPCTGGDSVWIAHGDGCAISSLNPSTRGDATEVIRDLLVSAVSNDERVLVGFDFPYGYPAGFARALGFLGCAPWRDVWEELSARIQDDPRNRNNRFDVAASLNRRLGSEPGPFYCAQRPQPDLPGNAHGVVFPYLTSSGEVLAKYRATERLGRRDAQLSPVWKLSYQPTVGSQALLGIPRLARLRFDAALASVSEVWPLETGFSCVNRRPYVLHCEIWPRVIQVVPDDSPSGTLDEAQVRGLVAWAADLQTRVGPSGLLGPPGAPAEALRHAVTEEGWILGVG
jgi:precorrin-8X/cobalt-precorrin-8 methylmutase